MYMDMYCVAATHHHCAATRCNPHLFWPTNCWPTRGFCPPNAARCSYHSSPTQNARPSRRRMIADIASYVAIFTAAFIYVPGGRDIFAPGKALMPGDDKLIAVMSPKPGPGAGFFWQAWGTVCSLPTSPGGAHLVTASSPPCITELTLDSPSRCRTGGPSVR